MDKAEKKKIRAKLLTLLDKPEENKGEIARLGKLLGGSGKLVSETSRKSRKKYVEPAQYIEWRNQGLSRQEISDKLGIDKKRLISEVTMLKNDGLIPTGSIKVGNAKKFTMTKEEYLASELTRKEICKKFNIDNATLSGYLSKWGLKTEKKMYEIKFEDYCKLKGQLLLDKDIEELYDFPPQTLGRIKRRWKTAGIL